MKVQDRIRAFFAKTTLKAMAFPVPLVPEWARTQFLMPTYRNLCAEGVKANGIVFNCISTLAFAYPEPKLRVYRDSGEALYNHPLQKLLNRPNPQMGMAELLQYIIMYKSIGGSCYLYKVRSAAGRPVELWPLNDSQIVPVAGGDRLISHYLWFDDTNGKEIPIPAEDITHLKWMPDPTAPWKGIAPLQAVAREVDTDNESRRYLFALLKNDAIPRIAITAPNRTTALDPDEYTRFREMWKDRYGGENRGAPALLGGGLDVKKIGLDLTELAFESLSRVPEARIAGAFRVPPVLAYLNVGLEQMTYNNVGGMRKYFTENTLAPLWRMDADEITADLLPEFGDSADLHCTFDLSTVLALQEGINDLRTFVREAVQGQLLTVNEGRAKIGYSPVIGGDVFIRSLTTVLEPVQLESASGRKMLEAPETKVTRQQRRTTLLSLVATQRQQREEVAKRMEPAIEGWFGGLADHILGRVRKNYSNAGIPEESRGAEYKFRVDDLIREEDDNDLEELVKRFVVELVQLSWQGWNLSLGVDVAFDLADPAVTKALQVSGLRIKDINQTTLQAVRDALQAGSELGLSIDQIVRGDAQADPPIRGLRDIVEQTYKGRAQSIARTELGTAQNIAAGERYKAAGVPNALVLDNGVDDSHPACVILGNGGKGTIVPLEWALAHPLQHPRCLRGIAPSFADDGPVNSDLLSQWQSVGGGQ